MMFFLEKPEPALENLPLEKQVERLKLEVEQKQTELENALIGVCKRRTEVLAYLLMENEALHRMLQSQNNKDSGGTDDQEK